MLTPVVQIGKDLDALCELILESGIESTRQITSYAFPEKRDDPQSYAQPGDEVASGIFHGYQIIEGGRAVLAISLFTGTKLENVRDITGKFQVEILYGDECANPAVFGSPLRIPDPTGVTKDYVAGWVCAGTDPVKPGSKGRRAAFAASGTVLGLLAEVTTGMQVQCTVVRNNCPIKV